MIGRKLNSALKVVEFPIENCPEDKIAVKMLAASVNKADIAQLRGAYPIEMSNGVPGNEVLFHSLINLRD